MKLKNLSLLLLLITSNFLAANVYSADVLTLKKAIQMVTQNHPLVVSKLSEVDSADASLEAANWGRFPTPSLETASGDGNLTAVLRVDQPVWTGGRIEGAIDAAELTKNAAISAVDEARLDLQLRVVEAYVDALSNRNKLNLANKGVLKHQKLFEMMQRRVKQDINSRADLNLAESRLLQAKSNVSTFTQSYETALGSLEELTGLVVEDISSVPLSKFELAHLDILMDQAANYSPILKRLSMEILAAQKEVEISKGAILPQLVARFEHTNTSEVTDNRFMLVLQAQPGAGLSAMSNIRAAESLIRVLENSKDASLREIKQLVRADYASYTSSTNMLSTARNASQISIEVFNSYMRQFVTGRKTWIDVLNATREMTQAELAYEDIKAQSLISKLRLLSHAGQLTNILSE
ncbi:TolC family protein [Marinobacterium sp. xm-a-152]|uniref:TolC family protein n=1 Tax=Marinobacterium sp. xm-a-152 TaxID=2497733 RepID=UPI001568FDBD|nr:TolC family protein [Marinobacterium sp. xm-a-152]NRP16360.1 Outer membrane efflux protein [Marinobacterium sp. xm-a-152]